MNILLCILPFVGIFLTFKFIEYKSSYSIYGRKREYKKMLSNKITIEDSIKNLSFKNFRNTYEKMPILYSQNIIPYKEVIVNEKLYAIFIIGDFSKYSKFYFSEFMWNTDNKYHTIGVIHTFASVFMATEYAKKEGVIFPEEEVKAKFFHI